MRLPAGQNEKTELYRTIDFKYNSEMKEKIQSSFWAMSLFTLLLALALLSLLSLGQKDH